ncbi:hypothetical protein ACIBL8_47455 [Streptomyces sp. NPDC050523]|uniref:hypothetical protein n=1 Tax=Streptomyces sp. NPDC050523 TaxID=3365622 RepID=UPI0037ACE283
MGHLLFGGGGAGQVRNSANGTVWVSDLAAPGARSLWVTDGGDLELCNGMPLFNSRTGRVEAVAV